MNFESCRIKLASYGQEHLLKFFYELGESEQQSLLEQINKIDFDYMKSLYENKDAYEIEDKEISNIEATDKDRINKEKYDEIGSKLIKEGKPRDVLRDEETLLSIKLDMPFVYKLEKELTVIGINSQANNIDQLVEDIWQSK